MKLIIKEAEKEFKKIAKNHKNFINVIVDDWRGYRFIFDTQEVRQCQNKCSECKLYKLLKNKKLGIFSPGLLLANREDKKIFGKQNFLNCKTLEQYSQCYLNFIKKIKNKKELLKELELISNLKVIYSRDYKINKLEKNFKNFVFKQAINRANGRKGDIIKEYFKSYSHEIRL